MVTTYTKEIKPGQQSDPSLTWDEANYTWNEITGTWDNPLELASTSFSKESKPVTSFTKEAKP